MRIVAFAISRVEPVIAASVRTICSACFRKYGTNDSVEEYSLGRSLLGFIRPIDGRAKLLTTP